MNKSILIGMTAISLALTAPIIVNPMNVEAKVVSVETAAKKIYNAETKAYNKKKNVTVTFEVALKNKKGYEKLTEKIEKATLQQEMKACVAFDTKNSEDFIFDMSAQPSWCSSPGTSGSLYSHTLTETSYKNKKLKVKMTISGKNKFFRKMYKEHYYFNENVKTLKKLTEGMTEKQKVWASAVWLDDRMSYKTGKATSDYEIYKGHTYGMCAGMTQTWCKYAVAIGVKNPGFVSSDDHEWCCVKLDGKIYYFDVQGYATDMDEEYDVFKDYPEGVTNEDDWSPDELYLCQKNQGIFIARADEVDKETYCLLPEKQAKNFWKDFGKFKDWRYYWY